jgi:ligand-binding sensor domain-containing protein/signal transduction histidine kinase
MKLHIGKLVLIFLFLMHWLSPATAQRLVWTTYTTEQGLSGNYVYTSIQDRQGYLWFATDNGICRFDGYEFVRPVDTSAARGSEAFLVTEDPDGAIWFARLDGSLWHIEQDTVRAWKHNRTIAELRGNHLILEDMAIAQDGTVWLAARRLGLVSIDANGQYRVHSRPKRTPVFAFTEIGDRLLHATQLGLDSLPHVHSEMSVVHWNDGEATTLAALNFSPPPVDKELGAWRLRNGDWLFSASGVFYLVSGQQVLWKVKSGIIAEDVLETADGEILVAAFVGSTTGLFRFSSLEDVRRNNYQHLLPAHFVADIHEDSQGGWWLSLLNGGVMHCKNPGIAVFDVADGLPSNQVTCLAHNGGDSLFLGIYPQNVAVLDSRTGAITLLTQPLAERVEILFYDTSHQRLWCGNALSYWEANQWNAFSNREGLVPVMVAKRISMDPSTHALWMSATYGFFKLSTLEGKYESVDMTGRTFSVLADGQGTLWVTTNAGLRVWEQGHYQAPPFEHPALRHQPRDVVMLPDGGMAIGLRSAGVLIRAVDGTLTHFTEQNGLASDFITKLYCSPEGVLYACSNAGLSRLSPRADGSWELAAINVKSGLPSNEINDVITLGNATWLATNRGLVRLSDIPRVSPIPAPLLERLLINNTAVALPAELKLQHSDNNLSIRFLSLHYRSAGDILYRYRLLQVRDDFQYTKSREVNYANLRPGAYTFEVQAQNEAGAWSAPTQLSFEIWPAWWQTAWFFAALTMLLAGSMTWGYQRYVQNKRREAEIKSKIHELELKALRAQMNPHFIFNCLNSIQNYIAGNDSEAATRYLGRFARLVRLALHGSVDGEHSLREEMEMLDSYLALEQLRFQGRFSYTIEASPDLDTDEFTLPPMLVQPFVENALLHGLKNKTEEGRISVAFSVEGDQLVVTVTDNGPGFEPMSGHAAERGYRSVGMMLTQQRLALLSDNREGKAFSQENIVANDGTVCGARVRLML